MRLEEALVAVLNDSAAVTAIVADRIQCGESAPEWQSLPDLFFEVDHSDYEETFSGELEERRLQMVTLRVTSRARSKAVALQAISAATDAIRAASGKTITVDAESSTAIVDVQTEDPGSDGGYEELTERGTKIRVCYAVARFHVAYYDNAEPGEDADDDGETSSGTTSGTGWREDSTVDGSLEGSVNGTNRVFVLHRAPSPKSVLLIYRNGVKLKRTEWTLLSATLTLSESQTPASNGDWIDAVYF